MVRHAMDYVDHGIALIGTGGDIEEDEFVGSFPVIEGGEFGRVTCINQVDEANALDHASCVHVQAGDDALGEHAIS